MCRTIFQRILPLTGLLMIVACGPTPVQHETPSSGATSTSDQERSHAMVLSPTVTSPPIDQALLEDDPASLRPVHSPTATLASPEQLIRGVYMVPVSLPDWQGAGIILSQTLPSVGATWVALHPYCYQETTSSLEFDCTSPRSEVLSDDDIRRLTALAHTSGLRVLLAPDPVVSQRLMDTWQYDPLRGHGWTEARWRKWFDAYTEVTLHFARLAEETDVDYFVVGHELSDTTHREDDWRRIIAAVREVYHGPVTYGAIEYPGMREWSQVQFWDALDAIGINTGGGLTQDPQASQAELDAAWRAKAAKYEELSSRWGRKILFVELMAHSRDGAAILSDWRVYCRDTIDQTEQAAYYTAFARALQGAPWLRGVIIWAVSDNPLEGGPADPHMTFLNKPAESVLREFFGAPLRILQQSTQPPGSREPDPADLVIFDDQLRNGWGVWVPDQDPFPDIAHPQPAIGAASVVQAAPVSLNGINFVSTGMIDLSPYVALEFNLRVGESLPRDLQVQFATYVSPGYFPIYWRVRPNDPKYIYPYPLAPGIWHRVVIPLADLGVSGKWITEFSITDEGFKGCRSDPIVIDEVRLLGQPR